MFQTAKVSPSGINQWARVLGISIRPWSGYSPWSLILRGVIQAALTILVLVFALRLRSASVGETSSDVGALLGQWSILMFLIVGVLLLIAATRILVGAVDLFPRLVVTGQVVSVRERKVGDVLPRMAQRLIFERDPSSLDRRKTRTEVVLQTATGERQWTVRSARIRRSLRVGDTVHLTVTPLAGFVAHAEVASNPSNTPA